MMRRKIYDELLRWKNVRGKKPAILIEGARRVGKSYITEAFARNEHESYLLINFSESGHDEVRELFAGSLRDLDTLFLQLSLLFNPYRTVLGNMQLRAMREAA